MIICTATMRCTIARKHNGNTNPHSVKLLCDIACIPRCICWHFVKITRHWFERGWYTNEEICASDTEHPTMSPERKAHVLA